MTFIPTEYWLRKLLKIRPHQSQSSRQYNISINGKTFKNLKDKFQIDVDVKPNVPLSSYKIKG